MSTWRGQIFITGGGTGGHIFPMVAIADALQARGLSTQSLRFFGSRRGQEGALLADRLERVTLYPGRGLLRRLTPVNVLQNVWSVLRLSWSVMVAVATCLVHRPIAVVSVGGYAAFPMVAAAAITRRPLVFIELDAVPGAVHRVFSRAALMTCRAFPPAGEHEVVTGAPLRPAIERAQRTPQAREDAARRLGVSSAGQVVVVMTGSLGAQRVNTAVAGLAAAWKDRSDVTIVHVTGRRDAERVRTLIDGVGPNYLVMEFATDMASLWEVADVAVCRAGATTIAELTFLGVPSILVPLPNAPADHQTRNARTVADAGGAVLLRDADCTATSLASTLEALLDSTDRRASMGAAARALGHPNAAERIAEVVTRVGGVS